MARLTATVLQAAVAAVVGVVAWQWYQSSARLPPVSGGFVHPAYQPVADLFRKRVEDGTERGGSFAVYHKGEKLVDLWGGYANPHSSLPWQESTLTAMFSTTKGMAALSVAKLVERGLLDYKAEIQKYWPEFAQNNKSNVTLEMLMSHQAGLLSLGGANTILAEYQDDWGKVEKLMAQATTDFPPGSAVAYHGLTFAMYIDAIVRRVDPQHRSLSQFFDEEISKPLDAEFYIGLPLREFYRATFLTAPPAWRMATWMFDSTHRPVLFELFDPNSTLNKMSVVTDFKVPGQVLNNPYSAAVGLGSTNGFGPARSLAKIYDFVANGGSIAGKTLFSKPIVERLMTPLTLTLPSLGSFRLDFSVGLHVLNNSRGAEMFGHPGYGGQMAGAVPKYGVGIAYVTNFLSGKLSIASDHYWELEKVFYECFEKHQADPQTTKTTKTKKKRSKND
ncbi:hypothetical protein C0Q70_09444 [Pomacea canaliculata]|uniref:Beta-lactamase-related domain-containing protein n=1 Tax=Pomacea canaliculata TaxID=400727 RepID=A0A2T7P9U0_POMCA|nr:beta-lactamase domain-containing protein 2-like [Pomacea canaliculata]PVD30182.1 hypothetical protein C0Q70_09444 [Pomacea canaliculata]